MKGFTIKCNECGKETIYTQGEKWKETNNNNITIDSYGYTHSTMEEIYCVCGNKVEDDPQED